MQFSNDFLWGAASASYQIEGAYLEDGKGENIWDAYCQESGHVAHGENGNVACDHYHLFREDVKMMQKMGIKNYRFSISWTRILPDGTGAVNQKGIQFYSDLSMLCWKLVLLQWLPCSTGIIRMPCTRKAAG